MRALILLTAAVFSSTAFGTTVENRGAWFFDETNTSSSADPSDLKYFRFFDMLPDEVSLQVVRNMDLSDLAGKKVFIGYGIVDPKGEDCRVFPPSATGLSNDITVCLPWWRIERTYALDTSGVEPVTDFFKMLVKPKPPLLVNVCKSWQSGPSYAGGRVTCTTYYDRFLSAECYTNPMQPQCYVNNCSKYLMDNCEYIGNAAGEKMDLSGVTYASGVPTATQDAKVGLQTQQFECPAGVLVPNAQCQDESTVFMYPYECAPDDPATQEDDGVYVYCDEKSPQYDTGGEIIGFLGQCPDGRNIMCDAGSFSSTKTTCVDPVYRTTVESEVKEAEVERTYTVHTVSVLSGEPDIYSADPNCLRANTVEEARDQTYFVRIIGNGTLDDDIYVLKHKPDGSHAKIYCNMQHNEDNDNKKVYNGDVLQCIDNDGNYAFDQTVPVRADEIVSVQQNSEYENDTGVPFDRGRKNYGSTSVTIDGVLVAPEAFPSNYPYYPTYRRLLKTWDNATATFSLLFPFAGAYRIYFYDQYDNLLAEAEIGLDDFVNMGATGYMQLKLAHSMQMAPGFDRTASESCIEDDWVEWGGGVFGGRGSRDGNYCKAPNDAFVQSHSVYKVIVRDLVTGAVTPIPLVYPLPYPNRVFVSRLRVYEQRLYHCYEPFPVITSP